MTERQGAKREETMQQPSSRVRKERWHDRVNREAVVGGAVTGRGEGMRRVENESSAMGPTE